MTNGVPCIRTFKRVFSILDPKDLEKIQRTLASFIKEKKSGEIVSFDGKTMQGASCSDGRIACRKYYSLDAKKLPSIADWEGLQSVSMVIRNRTEKGKTSREMEYYISSCEVDARLLAKVVRGHWGIENSLHWVLDVSFQEDKLRYRDRIGVQNLASIRKLVLGALSKDTTLKCGKKNKRLIAATDPVYRERVLKLLF